MGFNVIQNVGLQGPTEKVQFPNRGHERLVTWYFEHNSLPTAIGVKILLGVGFELTFVAEIHEKLLSVEGITNKTFATVLGDKPVNNTETQGSFAMKIGNHFWNVRMCAVESLKA